MTDPNDKLLIDRDRGQKAKALLDNPLLKEAFESIEAELIEAWKTNGASMTQPDDRMTRQLGPEGRERAWQSYQMLMKVKAHLERVVLNGKTAGTILADLENRS